MVLLAIVEKTLAPRVSGMESLDRDTTLDKAYV